MKIIYIKRRNLYLIILLILLLIAAVTLIFKNKSVTVMTPVSSKKIGIDPGHGGSDPGAVSPTGIIESEINLKIALKLKEIIRANGGEVIITREKEEAFSSNKREDLEQRKEIIDRELCDLFISIHLNSFKDSRYYGAQVFYKPDSPESMRLADMIQEELRVKLDENNTRLPQERDDIFLLRELEIPSVLVECGFLSNEQEARLLQSSKYQEKIALGIYNGIAKFILDMEKQKN